MICEIGKKLEEDISNAYRSGIISINENVGGEGRSGSLKDEDTIINHLKSISYWNEIIVENAPRQFGDLVLDLDDGGDLYHINIKTEEFTTKGSSGGSNAFSKAGFAWGLSSVSPSNLQSMLNWYQFTDLINNNKKDIGRDYYYFAVNKLDPTQTLFRGLQNISKIYINPTNLTQVNWGNEFRSEPVERSFQEARDFHLNPIKAVTKTRLKELNYLIDELNK